LNRACKVDPLTDPRWDDFVAIHPRATVFHSTAWLTALKRTYGYTPIVFTTSSPGERLKSGAVFCLIDTWMYGRRLVSLPFSDHCDFLVEDPEELSALFSSLEQEYSQESLLYIEVRPRSPFSVSSSLSKHDEEYYFHQLDLRPDLNSLFQKFHKSSTQRKIKRAERENLSCKAGRSASLLEDFYDLLVLTRKRHGLPPQPRKWFGNLIEYFGENLEIRVAYKGRMPIAGILTLRHNETLTYKYGCSDVRFNSLGGTHLLFWQAIQEAKEQNLKLFDLGRSNVRSVGLTTFKERWGAERSSLHYFTFRSKSQKRGIFPPAASGWRFRSAKRVFAHIPKKLLSAFGSMFYKHIG
jgi:lipid II:glycine glycyltransferase (peptidoglycan interpeptide bridge formation enzyme)